MTNIVTTGLTWIEKELGILQNDVVAIEPEIILWAKNFLAGITPIIKQVATDSVLSAVSFPGTGSEKAAAALATAIAELTAKSVPFVEEQVKAAIKIAYDALPASVTGNKAAQAVLDAADHEVEAVATKVEGATATEV